jgi:hypothetical protein
LHTDFDFNSHFSFPCCKLLLSMLFHLVQGLERGMAGKDGLRPGKGKDKVIAMQAVDALGPRRASG